MRRVRTRTASPASTSRLGNLRTPTLLLLGGDSPASEKAATEALDAALPDGRTAVTPGQAHIAYKTAPEVFVREAMQFLTQAKRRSGATRSGAGEYASQAQSREERN